MTLVQALTYALHARLDQWLVETQRVPDLEAEDRGLVIMDDDHESIYLIRVYLARVLRRYLPALFIHRFCRSDHDRELHNHPWKWAFSLVLTGGYIEYRMDGIGGPVTARRIEPLSLNLIQSSTFHRVELFNEGLGAWTLFIAGPSSGTWGFLDPKTLVFEEWTTRDERIKKQRAESEARPPALDEALAR